MDAAEVSKICRSCGADVRHKRRHKSRDGTYLCPKCIAAETWWHRLAAKLATKKSRRLILYVLLAAIAGVAIWAGIDVMGQVDSSSL